MKWETEGIVSVYQKPLKRDKHQTVTYNGSIYLYRSLQICYRFLEAGSSRSSSEGTPAGCEKKRKQIMRIQKRRLKR
jgi:hypothetical protein